MSVLALLSGRLAPGVWSSSATPTDVEDLAVGLGWTVHSVRTCGDKTQLLTDLGRAVGVPSYVRPNWDSLADGLRDISLAPGARHLVVVDAPDPTPLDVTMIEILDEAATFWRRFDATFQVIWIGSAAAPRLDQIDPIKASRRSA